MAKASENKIKYMNDWQKKNTRAFRMILNKQTEKAIIDYMNTISNRSDYLKSLVKEDMQKSGVKHIYMLDLTESQNMPMIKYLDSKKNKDVSKYLENLVLNDMVQKKG